jgi:hypothetical protein
MKIYPSENASGQVSGNRLNERTAVQMAPRGRPIPRPAAEEQPIPEIRKELLVVQRSLGRYQSMLGGLEGFKVLLKADARTANDYISHVVYRGEAVLEPYKSRLNRILQNKDLDSLQQLIESAKTEIHGLAVQLSRLETAEQNSRSLALGKAALSELLEGIRSQGDQLLNLEGKNVLELLG